MIIGIPKEIKNNENRVSLTPSGAKELTKRGHKVYVQATAGANSGSRTKTTLPQAPNCCLPSKRFMPKPK